MNEVTPQIIQDKLRQVIVTVLTFHQHDTVDKLQVRCTACGYLRTVGSGAVDAVMAEHQADAIMHALNRLSEVQR